MEPRWSMLWNMKKGQQKLVLLWKGSVTRYDRKSLWAAYICSILAASQMSSS